MVWVKILTLVEKGTIEGGGGFGVLSGGKKRGKGDAGSLGTRKKRCFLKRKGSEKKGAGVSAAEGEKT